jgi:hypothetical protein
LYGGSNGGWNSVSNNGIGCMTLNRTSSSSLSLYLNNSLVQTRTTNTRSNFSANQHKVTLLALWWNPNYGPSNIYDEFGDQRVSTVSIGAGLTSPQQSALDTAIINFNTALGRNI